MSLIVHLAEVAERGQRRGEKSLQQAFCNKVWLSSDLADFPLPLAFRSGPARSICRFCRLAVPSAVHWVPPSLVALGGSGKRRKCCEIVGLVGVPRVIIAAEALRRDDPWCSCALN